jgi:5-methyltetrahydrofolate--homocysteine methyltransferase
VRIAPAYDQSTVHVLDASRVVGVVSDLMEPGRAEELAERNRAEQARLREEHATKTRQPLLTLAQARANAQRVDFADLPVPAFTGLREATPSLTELRELIDWTFLFLAWELKGKYPAILDRPQARELFDDANAMLDQIIADGSLTAHGVYGFWPAHADGDDIVIDAGEVVRMPMLRQQTAKPAGRPNRCLSDYVAPAGDHVGGFAVTILGAEELAARYEAEHDDYRAIMVKALADRLAEAFAEHLHRQARREWHAPGEDMAIEDLHAERFTGIRPAFGYPATPDHTLKRELFDLLGAEKIGMGLTESYAMTPAGSVSGLMLAHPDACYFTVGRLGSDQVADYAARRGADLADVERWLRPNLG